MIDKYIKTTNLIKNYETEKIFHLNIIIMPIKIIILIVTIITIYLPYYILFILNILNGRHNIFTRYTNIYKSLRKFKLFYRI